MGNDDLKATLNAIAALLEDGQDFKATFIREALVGSDQDLDRFLISNELWGGAGSIADEALADNAGRRSALELLLTQLGRDQIAQGRINERTPTWVSAVEQWSRADR